MNYSIRILPLLLVTAIVFSCSTDPESQKPVEVSFNLTLTAATNSDARVSSDLPDSTTLVISLTDEHGNAIITRKEISLLTFGSGIMTQPLMLHPGRYMVSEFFLINNGAVLYATPRRYAPLSKLVTHSLPYSFVIGKDKVNNVAMEVIDARSSTPEQFGYASFDVTIVKTWQIAIFANNGGSLALTDADLSLVENGIVRYTFDAKAKINILPFKGDPTIDYTLVVKKRGYAADSLQFNFNDVTSNGQPIQVILQALPRVTIDAAASVAFVVKINRSGAISIDWGDGSGEDYALQYVAPTEEEPYSDIRFVSHDYSNLSAHYQVAITGDLDIVTGLDFYGNDPTLNVNLAAAKQLRDIEFWQATTFEVLNLSQNDSIRIVSLHGTQSIKDILLSPANHADEFLLENIGDPSKCIDRIYENTIANNILGGYLYVEGDVSDEANAKLANLHDQWNWTVPFYNQ